MSELKLFPHQQHVLDQLEDYTHVGLFLDMGLGKTYLGSEKMKQLDNMCNLLICQKSKIEDWTDHFKEYYSEYELYNLRSKKDLETYIKSDKKKIGVINYELTFKRDDLNYLKDFTIMLDESSYIKNEKAKRTKFIMKLNYKNVILLSGTPISGKYEELWSQCRLLGYNISKNSFWNNYILTHKIDVGGFPIEIVTGYKNIDRLKDKLKEYGSVFMKTEEVIDLPDQIESDIVVKPNKHYKDFKKDNYVDMGDIELIGDNTLTQMLYERQLCGIYNKDKQIAFKEHLEGTSSRIIVFYNYTEEYKILRDITDKLNKPISVVNGKERDLKAYDENEDSVTFIQYQAGSKGLNLQKANNILYYSPTNSAENFMQSKKRIHRINQTKACFYYYMKVQGSIEIQIYKSLEKGEDFTNYLFKK